MGCYYNKCNFVLRLNKRTLKWLNTHRKINDHLKEEKEVVYLERKTCRNYA